MRVYIVCVGGDKETNTVGVYQTEEAAVAAVEQHCADLRSAYDDGDYEALYLYYWIETHKIQ